MSGGARSTRTRSPLLSAFVYVAWLLAAWVAAWAIFVWGETRAPWLATDSGSFAYWTALKILVWVLPALWLMSASGPVADTLGFTRIGATLALGLGAGLVLALLNVALKGWELAPPQLSWALLNAALIAPMVEEVSFRGAVLGALRARLAFPLANSVTAALFVLAHVPGWWFQGRLLEMLTAPIGGAFSIFVLGWLFGWIVYKGRSVGAGIIAHSLNNLTSIA